MSRFTVGDIVIKKRSKAKNIKSKAYRVTSLPPDSIYCTTVVVNSKGCRKEFNDYQLATIEEYENLLAEDIEMIQREISFAERKLQEQRKKKKEFQEQKHLLNSLFPRI
jgi:hypothetical protein